MKLLGFAAVFAAMFVSGCAGQPEWRRADGRPVDGSFDWAINECRRNSSHHYEPAEAMRRCMYRRGYVWS